MRDTPTPAVDLIKSFEGWEPVVYPDAVGYATIGYGHLVRPGETFDEPISRDAGEALLRRDLNHAERAVGALTKVPLTDSQFGALVSFVFNLGSGSYQSSTLRMVINRGHYHEAPAQIRRWTFAGGRKLRGLVRRRDAEAEMFVS